MKLGTGLANQGVIVTGVASGIGRATALAFTDAESRVSTLDLDADELASPTPFGVPSR